MKQDLAIITQQFIEQLQSSFEGEIDCSEATRQVFSTDNSIYQYHPQAIIYPKHQHDIEMIMRLVSEHQYQSVVLTARGGGTGTNGQSLTNGIVIDVSRHMNKILSIDVQQKKAIVQAGVVKDQLNAELKKYGLFFAPELSTSNRATIGGMINTDASGQGSCRYGKTHHHVTRLSTVLRGGEILHSQALKRESWQQQILDKTPFQKNLYHQIFTVAKINQDIIKNSFPSLNRSLTGYDLPNLLDDEYFNPNALLCGSEGTLGIIVEAELNVLEIPKYRLLINIGYTNFQDALKDANVLMQHKPLSIETVDSKVLNLAKNDIVWHNVAKFFPDNHLEKPIEGINLVELDATTEIELKQHLEDFLQHLSQDRQIERLSTTVAWGETEINHVYAMRKRAVGLLGNVEGEKRPQPFVEDTAVPPEYLAEYIADFRQLLDHHGLEYGMFGHVDAGVLHVRPALDMKDPKSLGMIKLITEKVVELTHHYGGVLWGEHGKGLRSGYAPIFFGQAYPLLQQIKALFDPFNQLNPGKIATPATLPTSKLIRLTEIPLRGDYDRQISKIDWKNFGTTMHCNGNGACFNYDLNDPMCPSYKVTRNRIHSPKGRATLVKEWLRREENQQSSMGFDQEVYEALHGCLSCKSCVGQCPVKVDIPDAKARFLARYHQRYPRQLRDYILAKLEFILPQVASISSLYNVTQRLTLLKSFQKKILRMTDIPLFHPKVKERLQTYGAVLVDQDLNNLPSNEHDVVFIVQDAFTRYFDTSVFLDLITLIKKLGAIPYVLPYFPNGKPLHVHGFLDEFEKLRRKNITLLNQVSDLGYPIVGLDPAMTLVFRQEYHKRFTEELPEHRYQVMLVQEWLKQRLDEFELPKLSTTQSIYYLAGHCTERTQEPKSNQMWKNIFQVFGLELESLTLGCCGMAGTYGHETEHLNQSKMIYQQSWQSKVELHHQWILATGYSCRTQVKRLEKTQLRHPIQVLLEKLG
ncbi:FAD-binding and (Fe-S)-binding domain-containing protein [uncultured Acinetobacter sp.]|uniref:FAD-binding and (Fe-S)-binding domain-containing protein n=1 Tax=uncultured Acinetobacter sp. TaxID=165433 RepID=UPI0025840E6A|nr:FAD-binding and (Fe-S)-binding domain-containing protein [uncultured Acinetobacter sp.]